MLRCALVAALAAVHPAVAAGDPVHDLYICEFSSGRAIEIVATCGDYPEEAIDAIVEEERCTEHWRAAFDGAEPRSEAVGEILALIVRDVWMQHAQDGLWPYAAMLADAENSDLVPSEEEQQAAWCAVAEREIEAGSETGALITVFREELSGTR